LLGWISTEDGLPHVQRAKGDHVVKHSAPALHVVLVHPEIHWNTRTVGRTCLGVGAQLHLVEPLGFSLDAREVRRSGLDYWPRVNPCVWPDWASLEAALPEVGTPYLFSAEAHTLFWDARYEDPTVVVFRKESGACRPRSGTARPRVQGAARTAYSSSPPGSRNRVIEVSLLRSSSSGASRHHPGRALNPRAPARAGTPGQAYREAQQHATARGLRRRCQTSGARTPSGARIEPLRHVSPSLAIDHQKPT